MAVYRVISQFFWTDPKVDDDFTPEDKYFFLYLLTNPHTNICGCYEIGMKQICRETGYNEDTVQRLIKRMDQVHGVMKYDPRTKEFLILNWHKYNWNKSEKTMKGVNEVAQHIKSDSFYKYLYDLSIEYGYPIDTPSIGHTCPMEPSVSVSDTVTVSDSVSVSDTVKEKKSKFSEFAGEDSDLLKALNEFAAMRKQIKKPLTPGAVDRLLNNLAKFNREEWIPILNQSTDHCWQDIYPIKQQQSNGQPLGRTAQMLQDSYDMMDRWAESHAGE